MTVPLETPTGSATVADNVNGHASTTTNGSHEAATNGNGAAPQHEELQYLNLISDIMARGQTRVSLSFMAQCLNSVTC